MFLDYRWWKRWTTSSPNLSSKTVEWKRLLSKNFLIGKEERHRESPVHEHNTVAQHCGTALEPRPLGLYVQRDKFTWKFIEWFTKQTLWGYVSVSLSDSVWTVWDFRWLKIGPNVCFSTTNEHLSFKNVLMKRTTTQFGITSNTGHVCLVNSDISLLYAKKTDLVTSPKYKRYSPFRLYNVFLQAWRTSQTKHCFCIPSNQAERKARREFHN